MVNRYGESYINGVRAEALFEIAASEISDDVRAATVHENRVKHVDYFVSGDGVDVKAKKRVCRKHSETMDVGVWVELQGRRGPGWLFGSAATWIAFETDANAYTPSKVQPIAVSPDHVLSRFNPTFLMVNREGLEQWIRTLELSSTCSNPSDAWYKVYSRHTDQITIVSLTDLVTNVPSHVQWSPTAAEEK